MYSSCHIRVLMRSPFRNVGFLKYWTVSNIPLFMLATPMLCLLTRSAWLALSGQCSSPSTEATVTKKKPKNSVEPYTKAQLHRDALLVRLALPQLALAASALTSFHVQIVTRLSSGYPLWYLVLANEVLSTSSKKSGLSSRSLLDFDTQRLAKWTVRWMVIYGLVQGTLFASFLPPA
jgi:phosphatidylinositol glycan class V